jgi:hypothetical protein
MICVRAVPFAWIVGRRCCRAEGSRKHGHPAFAQILWAKCSKSAADEVGGGCIEIRARKLGSGHERPQAKTPAYSWNNCADPNE